jgi:two-component system, response regulator PdtaR
MEQDGERRCVLLVEDEVLMRLSIADELRHAGLTVLEAANADEASVILKTHPQRVGVLLTDIQMPGSMDGLALVRLVRERYPETRVVVLSGAGPQVLQGIDADAVFAKPHASSLLVRQIKLLLQGQTDNGSRNSNAGNN